MKMVSVVTVMPLQDKVDVIVELVVDFHLEVSRFSE